MGRYQVSATAFPFEFGPEAQADLIVSVTDDQGSPKTSLAKGNFRVHVMVSSLNTVGVVSNFQEYTKLAPLEAADLAGVYLVRVEQPGLLASAYFTFVIRVVSGGRWFNSKSEGWTVVGFDYRQPPA